MTKLFYFSGGHFSLLFSAAFPHLIDRTICIDIFKPLSYHGEKWANKVERITEMHRKFESSFSNDPSTNAKVPVYSEPDAIKRMMEAHGNSLNEESAKALMIRGTQKHKWGVTFSRDVRLKIPSVDPPPTDEQMLKFMSNIRSDLLIIRARQTPYHLPEDVRLKFYDVYQNNCRYFKDVLLDGTHHLHMNNPDRVGPVINDFITESLLLNLKPSL